MNKNRPKQEFIQPPKRDSDNLNKYGPKDEYRELLIGSGSKTGKKISVVGHEQFTHVTRLDINPDHKPDIVWDLRQHPLPFENDSFDEIHAYEVLEHLAMQGDYKFFFAEFS